MSRANLRLRGNSLIGAIERSRRVQTKEQKKTCSTWFLSDGLRSAGGFHWQLPEVRSLESSHVLRNGITGNPTYQDLVHVAGGIGLAGFRRPGVS